MFQFLFHLKMFGSLSYLLHLSRVIMIIAPIKADITETIAMVKAHPSSPVASARRKKHNLNLTGVSK